MEKSIRPNQDLVPALKASIQNPANLCEGIAADGWIRGGLPSRELSRDQDYFTKFENIANPKFMHPSRAKR